MLARVRQCLRESSWLSALNQWNARDEAALRYFSKFVPRGTIVFDVGANYGNRTKHFLRLGAKVVAFEPQPEGARSLVRALARTGNLELVNQGLGAAPGRQRLLRGSRHVLASLSTTWISAVQRSGRFANQTWPDQIPVELITLDQAIQRFGLPAFAFACSFAGGASRSFWRKLTAVSICLKVWPNTSIGCLVGNSLSFTRSGSPPQRYKILRLSGLGSRKLRRSLRSAKDSPVVWSQSSKSQFSRFGATYINRQQT
jgi:FkbM family methyltransferase